MTNSHFNDSYARGLKYLEMVQSFALEPRMVDVMENLRDRAVICNWIGKYISVVNAYLNTYLEACHECFYPEQRRHIQIFAAPLAQSLGIDGLCNIWMVPVTILIDVGRVAPEDWFGLVAHEYTHAHIGNAGHNEQFAEVLSHLCLGLGFPTPLLEMGMQKNLQSWPYCRSMTDSLAFWRGETFTKYVSS
ncbi:MAG: hypothetical protein IGS39_10655 [Calothrix sp. C42_A2020_038]|nr:hypothetical protein [Calothrix sp. C42_A2020_038]